MSREERRREEWDVPAMYSANGSWAYEMDSTMGEGEEEGQEVRALLRVFQRSDDVEAGSWGLSSGLKQSVKYMLCPCYDPVKAGPLPARFKDRANRPSRVESIAIKTVYQVLQPRYDVETDVKESMSFLRPYGVEGGGRREQYPTLESTTLSPSPSSRSMEMTKTIYCLAKPIRSPPSSTSIPSSSKPTSSKHMLKRVSSMPVTWESTHVAKVVAHARHGI